MKLILTSPSSASALLRVVKFVVRKSSPISTYSCAFGFRQCLRSERDSEAVSVRAWPTTPSIKMTQRQESRSRRSLCQPTVPCPRCFQPITRRGHQACTEDVDDFGACCNARCPSPATPPPSSLAERSRRVASARRPSGRLAAVETLQASRGGPSCANPWFVRAAVTSRGRFAGPARQYAAFLLVEGASQARDSPSDERKSCSGC